MLAQLEWVHIRVKAQKEVWRLNTDVFPFQYLLDSSINSFNYVADFYSVFDCLEVILVYIVKIVSSLVSFSVRTVFLFT